MSKFNAIDVKVAAYSPLDADEARELYARSVQRASRIAELEAQLALADELADKCADLKCAFDKGFPNSLNAVQARDEIFDALEAFQKARWG